MLDKNLIQEAKKYRCSFLKIISLQIGIVICTIFFAYYLAKIIDAVFLKKAVLLEVVPFLSVLLFVIFTKAALRWLAEITTQQTNQQIQNDLRLRLITHLFARGPIALAKEKTGELTACITDGIKQLDGYFTKFLPQCLTVIVIPPIIFATALSADLLTGIIFIVTAPLIPVFMFLIGKRAEAANNEQWKTLTHLSARFLDLLEGLTTLKIFNQSKNQNDVITQLSDDFRHSTLRILRVAFLSAFVLELTATLSVAIAAVTIGLRLLEGQLLFERAFFLILLAPEFYQPLRQLGSAFHNAISGTAAAENIYHFLHIPAAPHQSNTAPLAEYPPFSLRFENIHYAYQTDRGLALNGLHFIVRAGEHLAIVGSSGSGKSTIFQLLLQFARPDTGEIYIGDQRLSQLSATDVRKQISYLPQSPHIFTLTVAENIGLAKTNPTSSQIISAAKQAKIHEFITALPEGYQTILGEGGYGLSGGQKQRIAIARAFLQNAPIILLDEAMAGLDNETEQEISESLTALAQGKTMLTIAHRLHSAATADQIIVIENGRVAESGSHHALLQKQGLYAALTGVEGRVQ